MKNIKIILTALFTVIITAILSSSVYAGTVNSINATENEGKITVSGTVESSVYAVAVVVYSDDTLDYMETTNVNADGTYSVELEKEFDNGIYEVRVADYNGGEYKKASVEVKKEESTTDNTEDTSTDSATTENEETDSTDTKKADGVKTGDTIMIFVGAFLVATLALVTTKRRNKYKKISRH